MLGFEPFFIYYTISIIINITKITKSASDDASVTNKKVANNEMDRQLDLLKEMFTDDKKNEPEQNFDYIADRIKLIEKSSIHNIGMRKIQTKEDIINKFFAVLQKSKKKA